MLPIGVVWTHGRASTCQLSDGCCTRCNLPDAITWQKRGRIATVCKTATLCSSHRKLKSLANHKILSRQTGTGRATYHRMKGRAILQTKYDHCSLSDTLQWPASALTLFPFNKTCSSVDKIFSVVDKILLAVEQVLLACKAIWIVAEKSC